MASAGSSHALWDGTGMEGARGRERAGARDAPQLTAAARLFASANVIIASTLFLSLPARLLASSLSLGLHRAGDDVPTPLRSR